MSVVPVADALQGRVAVNSKVTVHEWVRTRWDSKADISLLAVHDGFCSGPVQVVISNSLPSYNEGVLRLTTGCSVIMTGKVVASPGQGQQFGVQASKVEVAGWVEDSDTYPMAAKRHNIEYLREAAYLCSHTDLIGVVARIRHTLAQVLHRFPNEQGFFWASTPLITASDAGGTGGMSYVSTLDLENPPRNGQGKVDFDKDSFDKESFLVVSGQLNGEVYTCTLPKIHTFNPIFRAENPNTNRHLAEFWTLESEVVSANLNGTTSLAEAILKYVFKVVLGERADDVGSFAERIDKDTAPCLECLIEADFTWVDYTDATTILKDCGRKPENLIYWGVDLSFEHKRYLAEEHFRVPAVTKNYPKDIKVFYMRLNEDGRAVAAMDVLAPGIGEIIGGSQCKERLSVLDERMLEIDLNREDYWWYRDLRRYGTVPYPGFGLGFEHLIAYVTGIQNVRDVIPFPRTSRNASF